MTRMLPPLAMTSGTPRAFPRMANLVHPTIIIAIYTYVITPTDISPPAALIAGLALAG